MRDDNRGWLAPAIAKSWGEVPVLPVAPLSPGGAGYRALILINGRLAEVTDAQVGTGRRPMVLVNGKILERTAGEGVPLVLVNGVLHTLAPGDRLII